MNVLGASLSKKHIAIIQMTPPVIDARQYETALAKATKSARDVEYFYWYYDRNHTWDFQARPFVLQSFCRVDPEDWCKPEIKELFKNVTHFDPNYFQIHSQFIDSEDGFAGIGKLPGYYSTIYAGAPPRTDAHELGHNFWLNHAGGTDRHDNSDLMAFIQLGGNPGFNSPNLLRLGFIADEDKTIIESTQQILLVPIELNNDATHDVEDRYVRLKNDRNDIYISLRKRRGTFYKPDIRANPEDTVFIHEYSIMLRTNLIKRIFPGDRVTVYGISIDYLEYADERARINITYLRAPASIETLPLPVGLPQQSTNPSVVHNGLWYNPDFNGQGFDVQVKDNLMTVLWYTFNEHNASPRYYIGSVDLNETNEFNLYTTDKQELIPAGRGKLTFSSDTTGVFNFEMPEHGRGSAALEALAPSNDPMSGLWISGVENEGFSFQFFHRKGQDTVTGYWFTHGIANRYLKTITSQRWYMFQGTKIDGKYQITIYEVTDGKWLFFEQVDVDPVGNATLEIINNNFMLLEYELNKEQNNLELLRLIRLF